MGENQSLYSKQRLAYEANKAKNSNLYLLNTNGSKISNVDLANSSEKILNVLNYNTGKVLEHIETLKDHAESITNANDLISQSTKHQVDWINVVTNGVANDGITDVTLPLQQLIDTAPTSSVIYFPRGSYLISAGLKLNKEITLLGCLCAVRENSYYQNYSKIIMKSGVSNVTMISTATTGIRVAIRDLALESSSYTQSVNKSAKPISGNPMSIYNVQTVDTGVNGINIGKWGSVVENVSVYGFSGYGISIGVYNYMRFCFAYSCGVGFQIDTDNSVVQCRTAQCGNAMIVTGVANTVSNFRIDGCSLEAILFNHATRNNFSELLTDQINYCAIKLTDSYGNNISGDLSRCGQYYAGSDISTIPDSDKYKACAIANYGTSNNNIFNCTISCEEALDDGLLTSRSPSCKIVNYGYLVRSIFTLSGDSFNGANDPYPIIPTSITEMNKWLYILPGGASVSSLTINVNNFTIRYIPSTNDHQYATINGIRSLNTYELSYIAPNYTGEQIVYNSDIYIGTGITNGKWQKLTSKTSGKQVSNGNGSSTYLVIPHNLGKIPTYWEIFPASADAGTAVINYANADATNLNVYTKNPLPSGTNNISFVWKAEA